MNEQSNLKRHQQCPMRTHVGNCLIIGGFCTSIREDICDALHKSFKMGTRSRAVDKANDDAISREYIKTLLENNLTGTCKDVVVHTIENAPSVTTTDRTGEWKHTMTYYPYCSECEWMPEEDEMTHGRYNYCPNCGAKMGGVEE